MITGTEISILDIIRMLRKKTRFCVISIKRLYMALNEGAYFMLNASSIGEKLFKRNVYQKNEKSIFGGGLYHRNVSLTLVYETEVHRVGALREI